MSSWIFVCKHSSTGRYGMKKKSSAKPLVIGLAVSFVLVMAGAIWDQSVQNGKLPALQADYQGVPLTLTKRRTAVTYTAGPTHKLCRAGLHDASYDRWYIKPYHQRGVCRQVLIEAWRGAHAP